MNHEQRSIKKRPNYKLRQAVAAGSTVLATTGGIVFGFKETSAPARAESPVSLSSEHIPRNALLAHLTLVSGDVVRSAPQFSRDPDGNITDENVIYTVPQGHDLKIKNPPQHTDVNSGDIWLGMTLDNRSSVVGYVDITALSTEGLNSGGRPLYSLDYGNTEGARTGGVSVSIEHGKLVGQLGGQNVPVGSTELVKHS